MFWHRVLKTTNSNGVVSILSSVVSIYLYMARTSRMSGDEIIFIDKILRSMFGNDLPLYQIEQARQDVLRIREAAYKLNEHLNEADRIKLMLNLISLAYHERSKIHVMGSVEIVELADLLRLDVSILDRIYDLFEGFSDRIALSGLDGFDSHSLLCNSMFWGNGGYQFRENPQGLKIHFIMIENLLLISSKGTNHPELVRNDDFVVLDGEYFYRIKPDESLRLRLGDTTWIAQYDDLWRVFRTRNSNLKLDNLLAQESEETANPPLINEHYLNLGIQGITISEKLNDKTLLHFYRDGSKWMLESVSNKTIFHNRVKLTGSALFKPNSDTLGLDGKTFIVNRHWELIEIPLIVDKLVVNDIYHTFKEGNTALKGLSLSLNQGEMLAIMGPSGSGKTTLLQVLLGEITPKRADIRIDNQDFLANFSFYQQYIGYVPQDDLLFPNLTVYENLYYKLKLCLPQLKDPSEINKRIENLLNSVGLYEQRNMIVGDVMNKRLSGGQRRRLNIALELVMGPVIIILDEPTSGLSSKDSENIVDFLSMLKAQGKIIITSIHQPNAAVFKRFDKVLLMERGGVEVFFGTVEAAFSYFDQELALCQSDELNLKQKLKMPELFFDLLEYTDPNDKRLYNQDYWEEKYRNFSFKTVFQYGREHSLETLALPMINKQKKKINPGNLILLLSRNFKNKLRSKLNLLMTLFVSPFLALAVAFVLRGTPEGVPYSFYQNQNSLLFDFISVIIFVFIGLANSIDDVLSEKRIIVREQKLNVSPLFQLTAKHLVLIVMTVMQVLLYYYISELVLSMRGFLLPKGLFYLLSGMAGYSMGIFFSAMIKDRAAIINILPLVIIPQIMFSGAVIQFAEMNSALRIKPDSEIPEFCQIIPSRWLYEGIVIGSSRLNSYAMTKQKYLNDTRKAILNPNISADEYMKIVDSFAEYEVSHPPERYKNSLTDTSVSLAHGRFVNQPRNIFLSHRMMLGQRKEISTLILDIGIAILMVLVFYLAALLKLRYWYR